MLGSLAPSNRITLLNDNLDPCMPRLTSGQPWDKARSYACKLVSGMQTKSHKNLFCSLLVEFCKFSMFPALLLVTFFFKVRNVKEQWWCGILVQLILSILQLTSS